MSSQQADKKPLSAMLYAMAQQAEEAEEAKKSGKDSNELSFLKDRVRALEAQLSTQAAEFRSSLKTIEGTLAAMVKTTTQTNANIQKSLDSRSETHDTSTGTTNQNNAGSQNSLSRFEKALACSSKRAKAAAHNADAKEYNRNLTRRDTLCPFHNLKTNKPIVDFPNTLVDLEEMSDPDVDFLPSQLTGEPLSRISWMATFIKKNVVEEIIWS